MVTPYGVKVTYYRDTEFKEVSGRGIETSLVKDYEDVRPTPKTPRNGWSSRWEGYLVAPVTTDYVLIGQSVDGLRIFIDDDMVLNRWREQKWEDSWMKKTVTMTAGKHAIRVECFNLSGNGALNIRWCGGPIEKPETIGVPNLRLRP